jgi:peroxiredoxin Q/BCP
MKPSLRIGGPAPDFKLQDESEFPHQLRDYLGQWLVLYFYPRDNTPGCTTEACGFRDQYSKLKKLAHLVGISADSPFNHQKFITKHHLPFLLLSDPDHLVSQAYQVWVKKKFMGKEYMGITRTTFIINPKSQIAQIYSRVKPQTHPETVFNDLVQLTK